MLYLKFCTYFILLMFILFILFQVPNLFYGYYILIYNNTNMNSIVVTFITVRVTLSLHY